MRILHLGMDFNRLRMAAVVAEKDKNGALYVFDEFYGYADTPEMINVLQHTYPEDKLIVYPDASGIKRGSIDAGVSDIALLRKAGFTIKARSRNPFIIDRVTAVNNAFQKKKLFIDTERCAELYEALTAQVFGKNGLPVKDGVYDDILDAFGYLVAYLMPVRELKPKSMTVVG